MNYGEIKKNDIANGEGVRVSLFVSGCRHHCHNCFNPETWSFDYGKKFTEETAREIVTLLNRSYINGLTVLGGEPFEPENQRELAPFLEYVRKNAPDKTIWCYTGCIFEELISESCADCGGSDCNGGSAVCGGSNDSCGNCGSKGADSKSGAEAVKYRCEVTDRLLKSIDVLVDGPFIEALKDISLKFRGSSNQRIIDIRRTLESGARTPVLYV